MLTAVPYQKRVFKSEYCLWDEEQPIMNNRAGGDLLVLFCDNNLEGDKRWMLSATFLSL